jgi:hypothetical protein
MLDVTEPWMLVVSHGGTNEVLDRGTLAAEQEGDAKTVRLRAMQSAEAAEYGLALAEITSTPTTIQTAKATPVASVSLVATVGGGLGYVTSKGSLGNPGFMLAAALVGIAAILVSLYLTTVAKVDDLLPSRLDLIMSRALSQTRRGVITARLAIAMFAVALILAALSFTGSTSPSTATATIGPPTLTRTGKHLAVDVPVAWQNLPSTAAKVQSTLAEGATVVEAQTVPVANGDTKQLLSEKKSTSGTLTVETEALSAAGKEVGQAAGACQAR